MNTTSKIVWGLINFVIAGPSSIWFFIWTAFDTRPIFYPPGILSSLPVQYHKQSERPVDYLIFAQFIFNTILLILWGVIHSVTAQKFWREFVMSLGVPRQAVRIVYNLVCSVANLALFSLWSHIDVSYRLLPFSHDALRIVSTFMFLIVWAFSILVSVQMDLLDFVGFAQLFRKEDAKGDGTQTVVKLQTDGLFGLVRHPMYFFTLLAFVMTPYVSLDRLTLLFGTVVYLYFGVPHEEEKLSTMFGKDEYAEYRKKVPAIFPTFRTLKRTLGGLIAQKK